MSGFTKLFGSITESSVWCEDDKTLRVWMAMMARSNAEGIVEASVPGFASLCRMSVEDFERRVEILSSPDKHSRTPDHEGRRITAVQGEWQILNHLAYRDRGQGQDGGRAPYMREYRKRAPVTRNNPLQPIVTRNTDAEAEGDNTPQPPQAGESKSDPVAEGQESKPFPEGGQSGRQPQLTVSFTPDDAENALSTPPKLTAEGRSSTHASKPSTKRQTGSDRFQPPTREELDLAAAKIGLPSVEVDKFSAYYGSVGWKVGKNPMRSWIHALKGWEARWRDRSQGGQRSTSPQAKNDLQPFTPSERISAETQAKSLERELATCRGLRLYEMADRGITAESIQQKEDLLAALNSRIRQSLGGAA